MNKGKTFSFFVTVIVVISGLLPFNGLQAAMITAPTLLPITQSADQNPSQPIFTGVTVRNTDVLIYLNGSYVGSAQINETESVTSNFHWQSPNQLPVGEHEITAIAKDRTSLLLSEMSETLTFSIAELDAPTLIAPNQSTVTGKVKPMITGLTKSHTMVHVYIDGVYNGKTEMLASDSTTTDFSYKPFLNLSVGDHTAWAIAEDKFGQQSKASNILNFEIEEPLPAPIVLAPVVNSQTRADQPLVVGLAKNDLKLRVFIDHQLNGELEVTNHESGTANFSYQPFQSLNTGKHLVYVTSMDSRGKESRWSNIVYFNVGQGQISAISETAPVVSQPSPEPEEKEDPVVKGLEEDFIPVEPIVEPIVEEPVIEPIVEPIVEEPVVIEPEEEIKRIEIKEEPIKEEDDTKEEMKEDDEVPAITDIIGEEPEEKAEQTGLINEAKEQQGKLKLNLVIFILFLLAVIIWIFWVNRELIKERREQGDKDPDDKDKSDQDTLQF